MLVAKLIGGPGTGKTTELISICQKAADRLGGDPYKIGYVSFTRAACNEAAQRAAETFSIPFKNLRDYGWYKTIHGIAYRCLGIKNELLTDNAESKRWLEDVLDIPANAIDIDERGYEIAELSQYNSPTRKRTADIITSLQLWCVARNKLFTSTLSEVVEQSREINPASTPPLEFVVQTIETYEREKREQARLDFTDLILSFAGWEYDTIHGAKPTTPIGNNPDDTIQAWIQDEAQDSSCLLDQAFRRVISRPNVRYVYLAFDPFQAIYTWAGADHKIALTQYREAKSRVMPQSWRCPAPILALAERVISRCSDYFARNIQPAQHVGNIQDCYDSQIAQLVQQREGNWLLLARTNRQAAHFAAACKRAQIPYTSTRDNRGAKNEKTVSAIGSLRALHAGAWITGSEWANILDVIPTQSRNKTQLLARGTKAKFKSRSKQELDTQYSWLQLQDLPRVGATDALLRIITAANWHAIIPPAKQDILEMVLKYGEEEVLHPKIRIGTIHSAKGQEADNVLLSCAITQPVVRAMYYRELKDAELRVWYVGITRARHNLYLAAPPKSDYSIAHYLR